MNNTEKKDEKPKPAAKPATLMPSGGFMALLGGMAVLPIVFMLVFHGGAAYLSYQKYQSGMWAFIDFFFAYFYYPYYAFFLAGAPTYAYGETASPVNSMMGGLRKFFRGGRKH